MDFALQGSYNYVYLAISELYVELYSSLANELNLSTSSKQRKKSSAANKCSLLLVDRNLDLSVASLYHEETVFDKINNLLPNLNCNSSDLKINLNAI